MSNRVPIKYWTHNLPVEDEAKKQLINVANLPFVFKHLAIMPDVHVGKGCTIGTVMPTINAIVPACVGVDIGCGMQYAVTNLMASDLPDNLSSLRFRIERDVPHGFGKWKDIPQYIQVAWRGLNPGYVHIINKYKGLASANAISHLGSLGGGNHFIEITLDEQQRMGIMLHSGSRGIGNAIGTHFIGIAKKEMEKYFISLPDSDLSYLPAQSQYFDDYIDAVEWAQTFAKANRMLMMYAVQRALSEELKREIAISTTVIDCHHNYISRENHFNKNVYITRKGAVSARLGQMGIIPGSMGAKSFIVRGLGNPESFHSCSHGAGRVMSRTKAKELVTVVEHAEALKDVECRKNDSTLDETPRAYKNIDDVMAAQSDLVEIVHTVRQVLCVKG